MTTEPWRHLCFVHELAFRAACNEGAPPASRPVKPRVIDRIAHGPDAHDVFQQAWDQATSRGLETPTDINRLFYESVVKNPMWATLVAEQIAAEVKWKDLFASDGLQSLYDRGSALFEKFTNRKEHPAAATATRVVVAISGLWGVNVAFPEQLQAVTLPIRASLIGEEGKLPITFSPQLDDQDKPVHIPFVLDADTTSRMKLVFDTEPVKVRFAFDDADAISPSAALETLATELGKTNDTLGLAAERMKTLAESTSKPSSAPLSTLTAIRDSVQGLHSAYVKNSREEALAADMRVREMADKLQQLTTVTVPQLQEVKLHANSSESIVLASFSRETGEPEFLTVKMCTGEIGLDDIGDFIRLEVLPQGAGASSQSRCNARSKRHEGSQLDIPGWNITFSSIHRRWYGGGDVTATIRQVAEIPLVRK
jgi:hypothetical protein